LHGQHIESTQSTFKSPKLKRKQNVMRSLLLPALAAATVLAATATGLATDANAAVRHPHHRAYVAHTVRQDPYRSYNAIDPPVIPADPYQNYQWPPSGGAS
jgi:hypothetical protein